MGVRATGATLALCLGASQTAILVLSPVLPAVASDLDVTTAEAGQLRTVSGLAACATALLAGLVASRVGLRELLGAGMVVLAAGSLESALAPSFGLLVAGQLVVGLGVGLSYAAGVAAAGDWSAPGDRSRVLALALLGPPLAWVVGMPLGGFLGDVSWRLALGIGPALVALGALAALATTPSRAPAARRAGLGAVLRSGGVVSWSVGELLAYSAWAGALVFVGALFVEEYGLSTGETGLLLGAAAFVYVPGNILFRRWIDVHAGVLLVALPLCAAVLAAVLYGVRRDLWTTVAVFAALSFVAGGRTLAGSARGLDLAPELRLGVTGVRTAALQLGYFVGAAAGGVALGSGGYGALGLALAALFAGASVPHLVRTRAAGRQAASGAPFV
jgi:MFS transporter, DHA1 family, inner membrane transport protein